MQFAFVEGGLLCDIPLVDLSEEEAKRIRSIIGEEGSIDVDTGELEFYQKFF